jgi:hypothetical protein
MPNTGCTRGRLCTRSDHPVCGSVREAEASDANGLDSTTVGGFGSHRDSVGPGGCAVDQVPDGQSPSSP